MKPEHTPARLRGRASFARVTKGTTGQLERMRHAAIAADGAFPPKVKALAAMLWSIAARCEPCIEHYAHQARAAGATEAEAGEFLALAGTLGGCVGETWARKAFTVFVGQAEEGTCCPESGND